MSEEINMTDVVDEAKNANEDELKEVVERWFESTHMDGVRHGAYMISAAVFDAIHKNLKNGMNSSHRDFERAIKKVFDIVSVPLRQNKTQQNDSEEVAEEETNDGTAE